MSLFILCCVTMILKLHVDLLFLASVAVYVTVVVPIGNAPPFVKPVVGLVVKVRDGVEQLSVAVGEFHDVFAVRPAVVTLILTGQAKITGGVTSVLHAPVWVTVTLKPHVDLLFLASVAVYVTVLVPNGNAPPFVKPTVGLVVKVKDGVAQLSFANGGIHDAIAVVPVVVTLILVGQAERAGGVTSVAQGSGTFVTVTFCCKLHTKGHLPPALKTVTLTI